MQDTRLDLLESYAKNVTYEIPCVQLWKMVEIADTLKAEKGRGILKDLGIPG